MTSSNNSINELKNHLRKQMKKNRSALSKKKRRQTARAISRNFIANIPLKRSDRIAAYWPMKDEIDIRLLVEMIIEQGYICSLPVIRKYDKDLLFHRFNKGDILTENKEFGVLEPSEKAAIVNPNIIIVPLLAFDSQGHRLGFGGGFYDRTLPKLDSEGGIMAVGIAYSFQQVNSVPHMDHDFRLDCVVTEKGIVITKPE